MRSFSCFKPRDPFRIWSKELDKRVAIWARNFDSSFKLLLLGPAGAGKTTIMKQMKIIHFEGFSLEERQQKAKEIRANLLESVRELTACITASGHQIDWCDKENQMRLNFINGLNLDDQTYDIYAAKIYDYSKRILTDKGVEELFAKLNQLSITHRSQYLLHRVDEIRNVNYIPNNDDILQSRRKTSDIQKLEFQVNLPVKSGPSIQQTFCMFDVGGQRGERRKWIQVFDGVSAVMFLIDSSSFDAIDDENGRNKLKETINLFYEVWTTRFLLNSNFVLLFNKQDILKEKIERGIKIEDHFPEYKLYKFQPTIDRRSGSRSDKLNLFRSTSGRSTRSGSSVAASSPISMAQTTTSLDKPPSSSACPSPKATTKRKSASLYLFGSRSTSGGSSSSSSSSNKALKSPNKLAGGSGTKCSSAPATPTLTSAKHQQPSLPHAPTTTTTRTTTTAMTTTTSRTQTSAAGPRHSDFHDASALDLPAGSTGGGGGHSHPSATDTHHDHYLQQQDQNRMGTEEAGRKTTTQTGQQQETHQNDKDTANHYAYLKARSFIRDKFLQVTRQVHLDHEQRKFSSPNLPLYNAAGGTLSKASSPKAAAAAAASTRIDCPKRNVCYHYTTATDTENIRDLFENLQKMVLKSTMKDLI